MPSSLHSQAKFDPIPPDLDLSALVEKTPNFDYVIRISTDQITELGLTEFEKLVLLQVVIGGRPLVVEGWQSSLPPWLFSPTWLEDNVGAKQERIRDISNCADMPMTIGHYLRATEKLTNQWTPSNFRDPKRQRLYMKDIDCPDAWHDHLKDIIPQQLFYLNENVGDKGGPGASYERNPYNQIITGKGIAPAGDLMSNLPPEMRAQNMMCYIGHEGTYTPTHREMCATLGQNIMVETSDIAKGEKPGTSIWFMTETKDREVVSEYFLSMLGHDIEVESHFAQINAWKKAPFPVYIVEQRVGDFILIPPLAPHQVWNRGTRTMKVAWNRTTVETLELAIHEALPRARMVCRDEQYKVKVTIYFSLLKYHAQMKKIDQAELGSYAGESIRHTARIRQLQKDFRRLFALYTEVLVSEIFSPDLPKEQNVEYLPFDSNVTCSYCRCNIFNRFLTCKTCIGEIEGTEEDTYDICMDCYAMGRSCGCISNLKWVEQWQWSILNHNYEQWRMMLINNDGYLSDGSPPSLYVAREECGKKPVAQVCQEQLRIRPWQDITKPLESEPLLGRSDVEPETDDNRRLKRRKYFKRKSSNLTKDQSCHICLHREVKWKLAFCTTCKLAYCYGTLWRAFDLKPQEVMENPNWSCPKCLHMCSCGRCRKDPRQTAYRPKGTLLGHDTKCVADPRSVESLVDFSRTNLGWLRGEGDDDPQSSLRMQKLMEKAQTEKARDEILEDDLAMDENGVQMQPLAGHTDVNHMAIDPQLRNGYQDVGPPSGANMFVEEQHGRGIHPESSLAIPLNQEGLLRDTNLDYSQGGIDAPTATMVAPELSLDQSRLHRDRMMGMGYYEQANDADKILFDDPDVSIQTRHDPNVEYPRLPEVTEELGPALPNRRRDNMHSVEKGHIDEAHAQFLQAQKKQKLSEARLNGSYFMTRNRLEGGKPLIVKLPLANSKDFLRTVDGIDKGNVLLPRYNHRPARTSFIGAKSSLSADEDTIIVRSDLGNAMAESTYRLESDEDGTLVTKFRPSEVKTAQRRKSEAALSSNARRRTKIQGKKAPAPRKNAISSQTPPIRRKVARESRKTQDDMGISTAETSLRERRTSAWLKRGEARQAGPQQLPRSATEPQRRVVCSRTTIGKPANALSDDASDGDESTVLVDDNYNPIDQRTGLTQASSMVDANSTVTDDYRGAKLAALRMAEGEVGEQAAPKRLTAKSPICAVASKETLPTARGKGLSASIKALPPAPPGKLLSMAERQALAGKLKQVPIAEAQTVPSDERKSPPSHDNPTSRIKRSAAATAPIRLPYVTRTLSRAELKTASPTDSFSSDSQESIPNTRPMIRQALNVEHDSYMLNTKRRNVLVRGKG
ncbi:MAG: hypothetical protein M1818_005410 [Claussenomyces sp. TS43310]|nr:MAG: hypothetical protein M1818_005410 [Claussenomyces sp. TS43310]